MPASLPLELDAELVGLDELGDSDGLDHLAVLVQLQQLPCTPENNSIHPKVLVNIFTAS